MAKWDLREEKIKYMAKYDQGGGCPCGLHKECNCGSVKKFTIGTDSPYEGPYTTNVIKNDDLNNTQKLINQIVKEIDNHYKIISQLEETIRVLEGKE